MYCGKVLTCLVAAEAQAETTALGLSLATPTNAKFPIGIDQALFGLAEDS